MRTFRMVKCAALVALLSSGGAILADDPRSAVEETAQKAPVLARKTVWDGDHKITFVRVVQPLLPAVAPAATKPVEPPSTAELAAIARREAKRSEMFSFFATVRVPSGAAVGGPAITEITWTHEGRQWKAWSNVDFRLFAGAAEVETDDAVWSLLGGIGIEEGESTNPTEQMQSSMTVPAGLSFPMPGSQYAVDCTEAELGSHAEAFAALDALHAHVDAHRSELVAAAEKRAAENAAREKEKAARAALPAKDETLYFWRIK